MEREPRYEAKSLAHDTHRRAHTTQAHSESLAYCSAITSNDICATGFWTAAQDAYFDVRVFHPNALSNSSGSISTAYKKHEDIKKRAYGQGVREIEHGVFTPLVFSTTGGMGQKATTCKLSYSCINHVYPWDKTFQQQTTM